MGGKCSWVLENSVSLVELAKSICLVVVFAGRDTRRGSSSGGVFVALVATLEWRELVSLGCCSVRRCNWSTDDSKGAFRAVTDAGSLHCAIVWGALMFEIVESVSILVRKYQPG